MRILRANYDKIGILFYNHSKLWYNVTNLGGEMVRKEYDESKSGAYALGYIKNEETYLDELGKLTGAKVYAHDLNKNIAEAYSNCKEINLHYDANGNIAEGDYNEKTCRYAIETGFYQKSNDPNYPDEMIYATFLKDAYGIWSGIKFYRKYKLKSLFNSYRFGNISFKNYSEANSFIITLEKSLLPGETWMFKKSTSDDYRKKTKYDILQSYLQYVFEKILADHADNTSKNYNKINFSVDKKYALFNSGLLNKFAQDIYILGEVYNLQNDKFTLSNPTIAPGRVELIKKYNFDAIEVKVSPGVVEFFDTLDDIIFNSEAPIDLDDTEKLEHIIEDGIKRNRFPAKYKELFEKKDLASITTTLKTAIENSKKIAKRNYKYVVPQYRSEQNGERGKIQFLMPIYLDSQYGEKPDFALVLNIEKFGEQSYYTPETVLELPWAYNNARVICKPEDTWLNPSTIDSPPLTAIEEI